MMHFEKSFSYDNSFFSNIYKLPVGNIHQIAELSIIKRCEILEHIQVCDEITYAISGSAKILSGTDLTDMQRGQIHFIKKGQPHKIIADSDENFRYICIGIDPDCSYSPIASFIKSVNKKFFFVNDDGNIRILTELLINEFYFKDFDSNTMINQYLTQILISLSRILQNGGHILQPHKTYVNKSAQATLYHTLRYIDREYINIKNVSQIAEHLFYNECYLSRLFKKKMGITLKEYVIRKKIDAAMSILQTSNIRIDELSDYLNFATAHTFRQAFKSIVSVSPSEYKKNL